MLDFERSDFTEASTLTRSATWTILGDATFRVLDNTRRTLTVPADHPRGDRLDAHIDVNFSHELKRFIVTRYALEVHGRPGHGIRTNDMRRVQVARQRAALGTFALQTSYPSNGAQYVWIDDWIDSPTPAAGRPRQDVVKDAAHLWCINYMLGENEMAAVAKWLGVSLSTAQRYVREARSKGIIASLLGGEPYGDD